MQMIFFFIINNNSNNNNKIFGFFQAVRNDPFIYNDVDIHQRNDN